jgi:hypothetical protein
VLLKKCKIGKQQLTHQLKFKSPLQNMYTVGRARCLLAAAGAAATLALGGFGDPGGLQRGHVGVGVITLLLVAAAVDDAHYVIDSHGLHNLNVLSACMLCNTVTPRALYGTFSLHDIHAHVLSSCNIHERHTPSRTAP